MRTLGRDINRRPESLTRTLTASLRALPNYHAIFIAMSGWPEGNGPHSVGLGAGSRRYDRGRWQRHSSIANTRTQLNAA